MTTKETVQSRARKYILYNESYMRNDCTIQITSTLGYNQTIFLMHHLYYFQNKECISVFTIISHKRGLCIFIQLL